MATALSQFSKIVAPEVPGCPSFLIEEKIVEAAQQFCIDTQWLKKGIEVEAIDYTTIDAADNDSIEIDLTSYVTGITPVSFTQFQIDGGNWNLEHRELENDNSNLDQITKTGVKFYTLPDQDTIKLFPFTDQAEDFDVFIEIVFKPKDGVTTLDDVFYDDHRRAICAHAAASLQRMKGKAWSDPDYATQNARTYQAKMGAAKIKASVGRVTGNTMIKPPFFC